MIPLQIGFVQRLTKKAISLLFGFLKYWFAHEVTSASGVKHSNQTASINRICVGGRLISKRGLSSLSRQSRQTTKKNKKARQKLFFESAHIAVHVFEIRK